MTKYFLHGGYVTAPSDENLRFYTELLSCIDKDTVDILIVPFARDISVWEIKVVAIISRFTQVRGEKKIEIKLADTNPENLKDELRNTDIVFIWGGDTQSLQRVMDKIPNIKDAFDGKVVAGSSAGALVLSEYYYENDTDSYHRGLGIIIGGMICHWKDQYAQKGNIERIVGEGQILCIPEGQYLVKEG